MWLLEPMETFILGEMDNMDNWVMDLMKTKSSLEKLIFLKTIKLKRFLVVLTILVFEPSKEF